MYHYVVAATFRLRCDFSGDEIEWLFYCHVWLYFSPVRWRSWTLGGSLFYHSRFVFSNRGHRRLHLLRKWIVSIEQYVLRSVLVRNSAISYSDSRERHFMIKTYEKGLGRFWLFKGTCDSRCLYLVIFIIVMPSINSNFSWNP